MAGTPKNQSGLKFLFTEHDGRLFRPTRCWIKPEDGGLESWSVALTKPVAPDECPLVDDLKTWMLFEDQEKRSFKFSDPTGQRPYRSYRRENVLKQYVRAVVSSLPEKHREGPFWLLMPSIADDERRKRYLETLEQSLPGAFILPEPEMVIEYFRLVRRELTLERGRTGIFLVIDVGASTCNFTFVLTRKDEKVVESTEGRQRTTRLRAVRGDAAEFAGRWVDKSIMNLLDIDILQFERSVRSEIFAAVERAKVRVSETRADEAIEHAALPSGPTLTEEYLEALAGDLWARLGKVYRTVAGRFLEQIQGTDYAQAQLNPLLERFAVKNGADIQRILDAVIVAGGTSLLPGFESSMRSEIFREAPDLRVLRVGKDFPVAAAVGGIAHVLHQHYRPNRLHQPASTQESLADAELSGALPTDIYIGVKPEGAERAEYKKVLSRAEPFAETGGRRKIDELPDYKAGTELAARLTPSPDGDKKARKGLRPTELRVTREPGRMWLHWNPFDSEVRVSSDDVSGVNGLVLNTTRFRDNGTDHQPVDVGERLGTVLWSSGAPDVVIDLGMSKTVAVTSTKGPISVKELEAPVDLALTTTPLVTPMTEPIPIVEIRAEGPSTNAPPLGEDMVGQVDDSLSIREQVPPAQPLVAPADEVPAHPEEVEVEVPDEVRPTTRRQVAPDSDFGRRLQDSLTETRLLGVKDVRSDLAMLLLALAVRPFVMLAGPPGSGKSTLVRIAARLLDATSKTEFLEIGVQPHWQSEENLPKAARTPFESRPENSPSLRVFLFDEFNLARPERYLMPFFRALEEQSRNPDGPRILACATLNIDDSSRPPSPKIMDRCFLVEVEPPSSTAHSGISLLPEEIDVPPVGRLPLVRLSPDAARPRSWDEVNETVKIVQNCVRERNLRQDLLPSRRALIDVEAVLALYEQAQIPSSLLPEEDLVDRVISGRVLSKISGAAEQVEPLVDVLHRHFEGRGFIRCSRRLDLARSQLQLGFVSPWQ